MQRCIGVQSGCTMKPVLLPGLTAPPCFCTPACSSGHAHALFGLLLAGAFVAYRVPVKADPHIPPLIRVVGIASADGTGPNATIVWKASTLAAAARTGCILRFGCSVVWVCQCATVRGTRHLSLPPLPAPTASRLSPGLVLLALPATRTRRRLSVLCRALRAMRQAATKQSSRATRCSSCTLVRAALCFRVLLLLTCTAACRFGPSGKPGSPRLSRFGSCFPTWHQHQAPSAASNCRPAALALPACWFVGLAPRASFHMTPVLASA